MYYMGLVVGVLLDVFKPVGVLVKAEIPVLDAILLEILALRLEIIVLHVGVNITRISWGELCQWGYYSTN